MDGIVGHGGVRKPPQCMPMAFDIVADDEARNLDMVKAQRFWPFSFMAGMHTLTRKLELQFQILTSHLSITGQGGVLGLQPVLSPRVSV